MDTVFGVIRILQSGVTSNWWGLGCPSHCGGASWGVIFSAFLLGFLTCLVILITLALWIFGLRLPVLQAPQAVPQPTSRLARYLDESARFQHRGHWALCEFLWTLHYCEGVPWSCCGFVRGLSDRGSPSTSHHDQSLDLSAIAPSTVASSAAESRSSIPGTFPLCPAHWLARGNRLTGSRIPGNQRVRRAWNCRVLGKISLGGRISSPNRSEAIEAAEQVLVCGFLSGGFVPSSLHIVSSILWSSRSCWGIFNNLPRLSFRDGGKGLSGRGRSGVSRSQLGQDGFGSAGFRALHPLPLGGADDRSGGRWYKHGCGAGPGGKALRHSLGSSRRFLSRRYVGCRASGWPRRHDWSIRSCGLSGWSSATDGWISSRWRHGGQDLGSCAGRCPSRDRRKIWVWLQTTVDQWMPFISSTRTHSTTLWKTKCWLWLRIGSCSQPQETESLLLPLNKTRKKELVRVLPVGKRHSTWKRVCRKGVLV